MQRGRPAIPLQDPAVGGRGHGLHAQIAEEIHAPDRAAQDPGEGGNSDDQDPGLEVYAPSRGGGGKENPQGAAEQQRGTSSYKRTALDEPKQY